MQPIMQPGELAPPQGEIPFHFLPRREDLFTSRSQRFQVLAENHAMGDYLRFMGRLAERQQAALDNFPPLPLPSPTYLEECRVWQRPPFAALSWRRDSAWRDGLRQMLAALAHEPLPAATKAALKRLGRCGEGDLEGYAGKLLSHDLAAVPAEVTPFLAGALQVYWTAMTTTLEGWALPRLETANRCPVCGSPPVAGIVRSGGALHGLRYLCCSLCASQWHRVRGICSNCDATQGLTYFGIEGQTGPVTAESCDQCHTYLKIIKLEKEPQADPQSDDLAMLALDLLMDQTGQARNGTNLLFHPGNG